MNTTGKVDLRSSELPGVQNLDHQFFDPAWSLEDWQKLDSHHHHLYLFHHQSSLRGFALLSFLRGDDTAHLLKILIHPELRKQGFTQIFWADICHDLSKEVEHIYLEVKASNLAAIRFYEKSGFKPLRFLKGYYSDGSDGITMQLTL